MKLHLPTSLRAALLACFSLVAPLAQTVSTGAFVGGVITCSLLAPQAQAEVAASYSESLSITGSTSEGTPTILYIYDGYTADDGSTVDGNYLGDDTTASSSLILPTKDGYYKLSDPGTYDLTGVDITIQADGSTGNAVNFCADSTGSSSYSFGTLDVAGGRVYLYFQCADAAVETGYMSFETLTGQGYVDASLNHGTYSIDNENQGDFIVEFEHIEDYLGTIATRTGASWGGKFGGGTQIYINKVTVTTSGTTTTINGPYVYSENLTFYGAGKLSISVLNYLGDTLGMMHEGTMSIASLVLSQDLTLDYSGSETTVATITAFTDNDYTITLDLTGIDIANGFNLGISSNLSLDDFSFDGLSGTIGDDIFAYADASNGCWAITSQMGFDYTSDATGELSISALEVTDAAGVVQSFEVVDSITFTADLTLTLDENFSANVITLGTEDAGIDMTLAGSSTLSAQELVLTDGTSLDMAGVTVSTGKITANGETTLSMDSRTFAATTSWSGEGEMTINLTSGHIYIVGAMDYAGTITVDGQGENRYIYINTPDLSLVNVDTFVMTNGADFVIGGNAGKSDESATGADETLLDITVVLSDYDSRLMTSSNYYYTQKVSNLVIVDGGVLKNGTYAGYNISGSYYYTYLNVGTITSSEDGSADAILSVETESGYTNVVVSLIEDLNATVTTSLINDGKFTIGNITVGEGITTTIDCTVTADKAGSVVYSGSTLSMLNEGQLYIGCTSEGEATGYLTLSKDLTLTYAGDTADLNLANVCLTGSNTVYLDLEDLVISGDESSFDLGLVYDGSVEISTELEGWYLISAEDGWLLSQKEAIEMPGTVEINIADTVVEIELYADYEYTDESGEFVIANFAGVDEAASQIDVIDSNKAMVYFSGDVDTVISMQSTSDSEVNNALLVGSADGTTSNVTFDGLILSGENNNILWRDTTMTQVTWTFEEVTGEGSVDLAVSTAFDASTFENYKLIFNNVNDVNGTISNTLAREYWHTQAGGQIHISNVNASSGIETIIDGDIYTAGLNFTGAGSLSLTGTLTYSSDSLAMLSSGTLAIENLVLTQNLTLDYTGSGSVAVIDDITDNGYTLTLDVTDVNILHGFDLGLNGTAFTSLDSFKVTGVDDYSFQLNTETNSWYIYGELENVLYSDITGTVDASTIVWTDEDGKTQTLESTDSVNFTGGSITLTLDADFAVNVLVLGTDESSTVLTLAGSSALTANEISISDGSNIALGSGTVTVGTISAYGTTTMTTGGRTFEASTSLVGEGSLDFYIWGDSTYYGAMDFDGTIKILDSNTLTSDRNFNLKTEDLSTINVEKIILDRSVDLFLSGDAGSVSNVLDTTIVLSSSLNIFGTSSLTASTIEITRVEMVSGGTIQFNEESTSTMTIGTISSTEDTPTDTTSMLSLTSTSGADFVINLVEDFNGRLHLGGAVSGATIYIGGISVGAGITTFIDCKTGTTATNSTVYTGETLSMLNEGTLTIGFYDTTNVYELSMALANDVTLTYAGDLSSLILASVYLENGDNTVYLDFSELVIGDGITEFALGFYYDGTIEIANGLENWELIEVESFESSTWTYAYFAPEEGLTCADTTFTWTEDVADVFTNTDDETTPYVNAEDTTANFLGTVDATLDGEIEAGVLNVGWNLDSGTLSISGEDSADSLTVGTLNVVNGQFNFGSGATDGVANLQADISIDTINISQKGTLYYNYGSDDMGGVTTINLKGGLLSLQDTAEEETMLNQVNVTTASTIDAGAKGNYVITELTGTAKLSVKDASEDFSMTVQKITDYAGTIAFTADDGSAITADTNLDITISQVTVSAGVATVMEGYFYSTDFSFSGAGSLSIDGTLVYSAAETGLSMMNVGSLSIGTLAISSDLTLTYGNGTGTLVDAGFVAADSGSYDLYLDLSELTLDSLVSYQSSGFDLGVAGYTGGEITTSGISGLTNWSIDEDTWTLVYSGEAKDYLVFDVDSEVTGGTLSADKITTDPIIEFNGTGEGTVLVDGEVGTDTLQVSDGDYTFTAKSSTSSLESDNLKVGSTIVGVDTTNTVTLGVDTEITDQSFINTGATLVVNDGTSFQTENLEIQGVFSNSGETTVNGALTITEDSTIVNSGTLELASTTLLGDVTNTGTIKSEALEINANMISGGSLEAQSITLNTSASYADITAESLTVNQATSAEKIDVSLLVLTAVDVNQAMSTLALDTSDTDVLQVETLSSSSGALKIDISEVVDETYLTTNSVGNGTSLTLIESASDSSLLDSSLSITDISLNQASSDAIADYIADNTLNYVINVDDNDNLVLTFSTMVEGAVNISLGYYRVDGVNTDIFEKDDAGKYTDTLVSYNVLDKADSIDINEVTTMSVVGVDSVDGDRDVELNNVNGVKALSLVGNSAEDSFTFYNTEETELIDLDVINATVNMNDQMTITNSLTMDEGSVVTGVAKLESATATLAGDISNLELNATAGSTINMSTAVLEGEGSTLVLQVTESTINMGDVTEGALALGDGSSLDNCSINLSMNSDDLSAGDTIVLFDSDDLSLTGEDTTITLTDICDDSSDWGILDGNLSLVICDDGKDYSNFDIVLEGGIGEYLSFTYNNSTGKFEIEASRIVYANYAKTENGAAGLALMDDSYGYIRDLELAAEGADTGDLVEEGADTIALAENSADTSVLAEEGVDTGDLAEEGAVTGDLGIVSDTLDEYVILGQYGDADRLGAAVAGATTTSLGSALMSDVSRQLGTIRNRSRAMGVNPIYINEDMPYYNAWVSAEGGSSDLDADGTAAGHKLNSVGGSVGVDVDINDMLSVGVAYSYLLGDLTADGADTADGDLDSMYGSIYARINSKRWTHSLVATFGSIDASLDRTVSIDGENSYKTKGETDGSAFGLMYEVGYTYALNEEATSCLQPVFNVSYVNSSIDGYSETGSNAALKVGDQDNSYVSFGLGAVLETVVGEDMYNRASVLSGRLMFKADAGDLQSEADVSFVNVAGDSQTVKGAEVGAVGVEMGLGITIPVTYDVGAIFADVSCELRSGMTEVSGSVGYRFSF